MALMEGEVGTMAWKVGTMRLVGTMAWKVGTMGPEGGHLLSQDVLQPGPGLDSGAGMAPGKVGVPGVLTLAPLLPQS